MQSRKKPLNTLIKAVGNNVTITLKNWGQYWGRMTNADMYMNMMLKDAKEYDKNGLVARHGDVFIRGNNVSYISIDPIAPPHS